MTRHVSARRIFRILLSRHAGGRLLPALIQILLIFLWHPFLLFLVDLIPLNYLTEKFSFFWYRLGLTSSYVTGISTSIYEENSSLRTVMLHVLIAYVAPMLLTALLGWFGFRIGIRKPRPRWYQFVRFWWRTYLISTLLVPFFVVIQTVLPWFPAGSLLTIACGGLYFALAPMLLARRETRIRGRRIAKLCPTCQYSLRGISGEICPECGSALIRSRHGGFALDRKKYKAAETSSAFKPKRRVIKLTKVVALLCLGGAIAFLGQRLYWRLRAFGFGARVESLAFQTKEGLVNYSMCTCGSSRTVAADGTIKYPIKTDQFDTCAHQWYGGIAAWSAKKLSAGDVILVRKGGRYSAVKIISAGRSGDNITFEWFQQPDKSKSTFPDGNVLTGKISAKGAITFKNVNIPYSFGSIWYDFYYGGASPASQNVADPHYICFAGKVDLEDIDAADPGWIYKTWEDGKANGYQEDSDRVDLRLSGDDKKALEAIWRHLAPGLTHKNDEELAYFRHVLSTNVFDLSAAAPSMFGTTQFAWPLIKEDIAAGVTPRSGGIWDSLQGHRIAIVSTQGLGRIRGMLVPVCRTMGQDSNIIVRTDDEAKKVMMGEIQLLEVGGINTVQPEGSTNELPKHAVDIRIKLKGSEAIEGIVEYGSVNQGGLSFWLYPFKTYGSVPQEYGGSIHLTTKIDEASVLPLMRFDWISFVDLPKKVCSICGSPAESSNWAVCPHDGARYDQKSNEGR